MNYIVNYVMEENLFVNAEYSPVKHAASQFSVRKNVTKKDKKRVTPGWTDISGSGPVSFSSRSSMYYIMLTLHNPINPLNVVSTVFREHLILHLLLCGVQTI